MEVVQLEKFKRALKAHQTVAIHDLGENREIIAVERSADEMDQTGRSTEQEVAILGPNRRSELLRNIQAALHRIEEHVRHLHQLRRDDWTESFSGCPLDTLLY
jgi:RNA polymerase-binding transcription factor DksA